MYNTFISLKTLHPLTNNTPAKPEAQKMKQSGTPALYTRRYAKGTQQSWGQSTAAKPPSGRSGAVRDGWNTQWGKATLVTSAAGQSLKVYNRKGKTVYCSSLKKHAKHGYWVLWEWTASTGVRDMTFQVYDPTRPIQQITAIRESQRFNLGYEIASNRVQRLADQFGTIGRCFTTSVLQLALPTFGYSPELHLVRNYKGIARTALRYGGGKPFIDRLKAKGLTLNRTLVKQIVPLVELGTTDGLAKLNIMCELLKAGYDINLVNNYMESAPKSKVKILTIARFLPAFSKHLMPIYSPKQILRLLQSPSSLALDTLMSLNQLKPSEVRGYLPPSRPNWQTLHDQAALAYRDHKLADYSLKPPLWLLENYDGLRLSSGRQLAVPKTHHELIEWGKIFNNCVASYASNVLQGTTVLLGVKDSGGSLVAVTAWKPAATDSLVCYEAETFHARDLSAEWMLGLSLEVRESLRRRHEK